MRDPNGNKKVIGNAVCAYLLLFVSLFFLLNKDNKDINHPFVRTHVKSAFIIHLGFLITYTVFIIFGLGSDIFLFQTSVGEMITKIIFLFLLFSILYGVYQAQKGNTIFFHSSDKNAIVKKESSAKIQESEKCNYVLSLTPFIGFLYPDRYQENNYMKENLNYNIIFCFLFLLLSITGNQNLASLLLLFYIFGVVFYGINIFSKNTIISSQKNYIPSMESCLIYTQTSIQYVFQIFSTAKNEYNWKDIFISVRKKREGEYTKYNEEHKKYIHTLLKIIFYIPGLSIILLLQKKNINISHAKNAIGLNMIALGILILSYFGVISYNTLLLLIIPILFGMGYSKIRSPYIMPFMYECYLIFQYGIQLIGGSQKKAKQIASEKNVSFQIK